MAVICLLFTFSRLKNNYLSVTGNLLNPSHSLPLKRYN